MTSRSVKDWVGRTPDSKIPPRVRLRVFEAQSALCAECGKKLAVAGEPFEVDHITALINGGENAESNLRAICKPCHLAKTAADVATKATVARKRSKHLGIHKPKSTLPGSKGSKWKRKLDGTVVPR